MYYNECPICGATLDPGEQCGCEQVENKKGFPECDSFLGKRKGNEAQEAFPAGNATVAEFALTMQKG